MEQRSVLLRGIARVLNAGGSALVDIYDTATSFKISLAPGEKGKLKAHQREYEKKIEQLYYEIGKDVALRDTADQTSAATEAKINLVAEYRVKIERIIQSVREIEEREKAAARAATGPAGAKAEPAAHARAQAASEVPAAGVVSTGSVMEEEKRSVAEAAETQAGEMGAAGSAEAEAGEAPSVAATEERTDIPAGTETPGRKRQKERAESGVPVAGESSPGAKTKQEAVPEVREEMLKSELLKICKDRGIEANERMTKAAIIELIKKRRIL